MLVGHRIALGELEQFLVVVLGREQYAHFVVVQGVDQRDEASSGRLIGVGEARHIAYDDRMKELTKRQIVDGTQCPTAELFVRENRFGFY